MTILGIDPGTSRIGYGVVKKNNGRISFVDAGILKIRPRRAGGRAGSDHPLLQIKKELERTIKKYEPDIMAVEKIYFSKNRKTAMSVAEARGVILLTGMDAGIEVKECSPNEVKAGVAGYGMADKRGVAKMVALTLGKKDLKVIDDASDALAIAIFAANSRIFGD